MLTIIELILTNLTPKTMTLIKKLIRKELTADESKDFQFKMAMNCLFIAMIGLILSTQLNF